MINAIIMDGKNGLYYHCSDFTVVELVQKIHS